MALDQYLFDANVGPVNYIAVLTDWLNQQPPTATNLSDGFVSLGSSGSTFVDEQLNSRTANYALNLSASPIGNGSSAVPEPATWGLVVPVLAVTALPFRNRKKSTEESMASKDMIAGILAESPNRRALLKSSVLQRPP